MSFGLANHAVILSATAVGVDGTQSITNWTLSDFVLFGACHNRLFGDSVFKQIGVRFIPPGQLILMGKLVLLIPIAGVPFGEVTSRNCGTLTSIHHQETVE